MWLRICMIVLSSMMITERAAGQETEGGVRIFLTSKGGTFKIRPGLSKPGVGETALIELEEDICKYLSDAFPFWDFYPKNHRLASTAKLTGTVTLDETVPMGNSSLSLQFSFKPGAGENNIGALPVSVKINGPQGNTSGSWKEPIREALQQKMLITPDSINKILNSLSKLPISRKTESLGESYIVTLFRPLEGDKSRNYCYMLAPQTGGQNGYVAMSLGRAPNALKDTSKISVAEPQRTKPPQPCLQSEYKPGVTITSVKVSSLRVGSPSTAVNP